MVSVSSRVTSNPSGRAGAYLVIGVAVVLSLVMARVAFASTSYGYYVGFANPGVPHDSEGWNDRTHNLACRDDAVTHNNCQVGGIALISVNGYFLTRCWNSGTGGMYIYCETDRP